MADITLDGNPAPTELTGDEIIAAIQGGSDVSFALNNVVDLSEREQGISTATVTTTNATPTAIVTIPVPAGAEMFVKGIIQASCNAAMATGGSGTFEASFYRTQSGDVTFTQPPNYIDQFRFGGDSTPFSVSVDTGTQTARINVTGLASTTIEWQTVYQLITTTQ